jgi:hypothetical protein
MLAGLGTQHCDGVEGGLPGKVLTGHLMSLMMGASGADYRCGAIQKRAGMPLVPPAHIPPRP